MLSAQTCAQYEANNFYGAFLLNAAGGSGDLLKDLGWTRRLRLTVLNASGSEDLSNFPMLVHLDNTRIDYSLTVDSGADVRFTLEDGTLLPYEIERWNEAGTSTAWVRLPTITAGSDTGYFYLYYGNPNAAADETASSLWSDNYQGVWHFQESPADAAPQFQDSSGNSHPGTATAMGAAARTTALTGYGLNFVGSGHVNVSDAGDLRLATDFTLEALFNWDGGGTTHAYLLEKGSNDFDNYAVFFATGTGRLGTEYRDLTNTYRNPSETGASVTAASWIYAAVTYDQAALRVRFYKDGALATNVACPGASGILGTQTDDIYFGRQNFGAANLYFFGVVDEIAISRARRSDAYLTARNRTFRDTFLSYGSAEVL